MRKTLLLAALLLAAAGPEGRIALSVPPPVLPGVAAMPRIARPAGPEQEAVNAALGRLDASVRKAAAGCRAGGKKGD